MTWRASCTSPIDQRRDRSRTPTEPQRGATCLALSSSSMARAGLNLASVDHATAGEQWGDARDHEAERDARRAGPRAPWVVIVHLRCLQQSLGRSRAGWRASGSRRVAFPRAPRCRRSLLLLPTARRRPPLRALGPGCEPTSISRVTPFATTRAEPGTSSRSTRGKWLGDAVRSSAVVKTAPTLASAIWYAASARDASGLMSTAPRPFGRGERREERR